MSFLLGKTKMTTSEIASLEPYQDGTMVYNTTTDNLQIYVDGSWLNLVTDAYTPPYALYEASDKNQSGETTIDWEETIKNDSNLNYNSGTGVFTVTTAATYKMQGLYCYKDTATEGYVIAKFYEDSTGIGGTPHQTCANLEGGTAYMSCPVTWVHELTPGKNYTFRWQSGSNGTADITTGTTISLERLTEV